MKRHEQIDYYNRMCNLLGREPKDLSNASDEELFTEVTDVRWTLARRWEPMKYGGKPTNRPYKAQMTRYYRENGLYEHTDKETGTKWRIVLARNEETGEKFGWRWQSNWSAGSPEYGDYLPTMERALEALNVYLTFRGYHEVYGWTSFELTVRDHNAREE